MAEKTTFGDIRKMAVNLPMKVQLNSHGTDPGVPKWKVEINGKKAFEFNNWAAPPKDATAQEQTMFYIFQMAYFLSLHGNLPEKYYNQNELLWAGIVNNVSILLFKTRELLLLGLTR